MLQTQGKEILLNFRIETTRVSDILPLLVSVLRQGNFTRKFYKEILLNFRLEIKFPS